MKYEHNIKTFKKTIWEILGFFASILLADVIAGYLLFQLYLLAKQHGVLP